MSAMKNYLVTLDIELRYCAEVSASDEDEALGKAFEAYDMSTPSEHHNERIMHTIEEMAEEN